MITASAMKGLKENDQIFRQKLNIQSLYHLLLTKVHFYVLAINRVIEYGYGKVEYNCRQ